MAGLARAIEDAIQALERERLVQIEVAKYFKGGIETEEQIEAALS